MIFDSTQVLRNRLGNGRAAISGRKIGCDAVHAFRRLDWYRAGSRNDLCAGVMQHLHDGRPNAFCAAGDKRMTVD
jgi:hypothetical protein